MTGRESHSRRRPPWGGLTAEGLRSERHCRRPPWASAQTGRGHTLGVPPKSQPTPMGEGSGGGVGLTWGPGGPGFPSRPGTPGRPAGPGMTELFTPKRPGSPGRPGTPGGPGGPGRPLGPWTQENTEQSRSPHLPRARPPPLPDLPHCTPMVHLCMNTVGQQPPAPRVTHSKALQVTAEAGPLHVNEGLRERVQTPITHHPEPSPTPALPASAGKSARPALCCALSTAPCGHWVKTFTMRSKESEHKIPAPTERSLQGSLPEAQHHPEDPCSPPGPTGRSCLPWAKQVFPLGQRAGPHGGGGCRWDSPACRV